jgi:diguanylate cyclase (GGDEF)-like protein/PAS domain S-box-containing protein
VRALSRNSAAPPDPYIGRTQESEFRLLDWVPDAVVISDSRGTIIFANLSVERMTGYERDELIRSQIELLVPERLRSAHRRHRARYYRGRAGPRPMGGIEHDFMIRRKDGREIAVDIALGSVDTRDGSMVVSVIRDITERKELESALEQRALHDPLTGLPNRILCFDRLKQALLSSRREHTQVALVMLDLDGFKEVNDVHGHAVGDALLKELGVRLSAQARATDTVARIGGDEFAWVMPRVAGQPAVEKKVRRQMQALERPIQLDKARIAVAVSAGVALYPRDGRDLDTLMSHADAAMYAAKREGRGLAFYATRTRRGPMTVGAR